MTARDFILTYLRDIGPATIPELAMQWDAENCRSTSTIEAVLLRLNGVLVTRVSQGPYYGKRKQVQWRLMTESERPDAGKAEAVARCERARRRLNRLRDSLQMAETEYEQAMAALS